MSSPLTAVAVTGLLALAVAAAAQDSRDPKDWAIHDLNRPAPRVVDPGGPGKAPSDAVVLFDGKDLSKWKSAKSGAAPWKVENGYFEVVKGTGGIETTDAYGDGQLHIEWMAPSPAVGESQDRGNSGVFFGPYEVQVLDSYNSKTYPDGQAGALYGQYPPLVNAARPPGEWQTYDIIFHGARFDAAGNATRPTRITVIHNGVVVQDNQDLTGPTKHKARPPYKAHAEKLPIALQDHSHPVRFRNVWFRELPAGKS
jgi:3-keto-disaccharide hydrolase